MSQTPNPFSDIPTNPYHSPSAEAWLEPEIPFTREQARNRMFGPAIGIGIMAFLWMVIVFVSLVVLLSDAPFRLSNDSSNHEIEVISTITMLGMILLAPPLLMILGSVQMLRARSRFCCWAGVITAALPLTPCFPVTLALAIWGICVLKNPRVHLSFHDKINFYTLP